MCQLGEGSRGYRVLCYQWKWHAQLSCTSSGIVSGAGAGALLEDEPAISYCSSSSASISTTKGLLHATQVDIFRDGREIVMVFCGGSGNILVLSYLIDNIEAACPASTN